MNGWSRG